MENLDEVRLIVARAIAEAGEAAGIPEVPDTYAPIPSEAVWLERYDALRGFAPCIRHIQQAKWWRIELDPTELNHTLREPASVISGCVLAHVAGLDHTGICLDVAKEAGDFLLWAQERAGEGLYPFPAFRGATTDKAFLAAGRYLARAEQAGRLDQVVRNGWMYDDAGDGGLQFDNGEAGVAMFDLYSATGEKRYLLSALKAADWAASRPLVANWNYNSFSVYLLAKAHQVTGKRSYLDAAVRKARIGVIPGQLTDGPRTGRWFDPHNSRPAYHYIILRSLAVLGGTMPMDHPSRPEIVQALVSGLHARNVEFEKKGAPTIEKALEALLIVNGAFAGDEELVRESRSDQALDALGRLLSVQAREGKVRLAPREWAMFLDYAVRRESPGPLSPSP